MIDISFQFFWLDAVCNCPYICIYDKCCPFRFSTWVLWIEYDARFSLLSWTNTFRIFLVCECICVYCVHTLHTLVCRFRLSGVLFTQDCLPKGGNHNVRTSNTVHRVWLYVCRSLFVNNNNGPSFIYVKSNTRDAHSYILTVFVFASFVRLFRLFRLFRWLVLHIWSVRSNERVEAVRAQQWSQWWWRAYGNGLKGVCNSISHRNAPASCC